MSETKFIKRKKPNYKRIIILLVILVIVAFIFYNIETLLTGLFEVRD